MWAGAGRMQWSQFGWVTVKDWEKEDPSPVFQVLMEDKALRVTPQSWEPGGVGSTVVAEVRALGRSATIRGHIAMEHAEPLARVSDSRCEAIVRFMIRRLFEQEDVATGMVLRAGLETLLCEATEPHEQEMLCERLGLADVEELLAPLVKELEEREQALWRESQATGYWWDDFGEWISSSVSDTVEGPLADFIDAVVEAETRPVLERLHVEVTRPASPQRTTVMVGRNKRCPCGSGRKYERCCGA